MCPRKHISQILFVVTIYLTMMFNFHRARLFGKCFRTSMLGNARISLAGISHLSEIAAGGISRFILTRLCYSQILSIQNLFQTLYVRYAK